MATKFGCLFIFVIILQLLPFSLCGNDILQDKFTSRCDEICGIAKDASLKVNIWLFLLAFRLSTHSFATKACVKFVFVFLRTSIAPGREKGVPTRVSIL